MNKYKVFLETYVEAEDYLTAAFAGYHKLDPLGDVQFQFEIVDVHHFTSDGWKSPTGIVEMLERYR